MNFHSASFRTPLVVELEAVEQHALGEDVGNVDDQPRRRGADVDVVGGVGREADQFALEEHRHDDGDVRRWLAPK